MRGRDSERWRGACAPTSDGDGDGDAEGRRECTVDAKLLKSESESESSAERGGGETSAKADSSVPRRESLGVTVESKRSAKNGEDSRAEGGTRRRKRTLEVDMRGPLSLRVRNGPRAALMQIGRVALAFCISTTSSSRTFRSEEEDVRGVENASSNEGSFLQYAPSRAEQSRQATQSAQLGSFL
jgi:hypothetical protein